MFADRHATVTLVEHRERRGLFGGRGIAAAYREWRYERDLVAISRALRRLSERRLAMIGLSKTTLDVDVERMADRASRIRAALPPPGEHYRDLPLLR